MPNHVDQDLVVSGDTTALKEFMEFAQEGDKLLSADKFIPYPKEYRDKDEEGERLREECTRTNDWTKYSGFKDGFNSGGYEWCVQNWGTKWGIYDTVVKSQKLTGKNGRVKYNCNSAWSPATKIVLAMSQKFPTLTFDMKYYECGMQFKGHYIVKGGEVLEDTDEKYTGRRGG